ncbi:hypothetical protein QBD01_000390 [Ochrobactrum sp. 19YEA23]|nr:hypothetical protein [Ochrobactrum sp. 19YEA23]
MDWLRAPGELSPPGTLASVVAAPLGHDRRYWRRAAYW